MDELYVIKTRAMAKARSKNSKFRFEFDSKRKVLSEASMFVRGDVPLLSKSDYHHFPNTDRKAKKMDFNSKSARRTAERSLLI